MRNLLAVALLAVSATVLAGATCVTHTNPGGEAGPWVGEVAHSGDPVYDVYSFARIFDARDREFFTSGEFRARVCPFVLRSGDIGVFALSVDTANVYGAGLVPPQTPLRAEFSPLAQGASSSTLRPDGLSAKVISRTIDVFTVEIRNDGDVPYSDVELCGIRIWPFDGSRVSVAFADGSGYPRLLQPGEAMNLDLKFVWAAKPGSADLFVQGVPRPPVEHCCGQPPPADWRRLEAGTSFSVAAPPGWTYTPAQGIDSLVGAFEGDGIRITFDYGWYSSLGAFEGDPAFSFSRGTIDGYEAAFATPKAARPGLTGVLVEIDDMTSLSMHAFDLTAEQQELVFAIFQSLEVTP